MAKKTKTKKRSLLQRAMDQIDCLADADAVWQELRKEATLEIEGRNATMMFSANASGIFMVACNETEDTGVELDLDMPAVRLLAEYFNKLLAEGD